MFIDRPCQIRSKFPKTIDLMVKMLRSNHSERLLIVVGIAALVSASCGKSPKDATAENFQAAIQAVLDKQPACIAVSVPSDHPDSMGQVRPDVQLDALVRVGLVSKVTAKMQETERDMAAVVKGSPPRVVSGLHYDLTDKGKQYLGKKGHTISSASLLGLPVRTLCFGKKQFIAVVRYTEPSQDMGQMMTKVTYRYKLTNVPDWARDGDVTKAYAASMHLEPFDRPREDTMTLVLTSDGWRAPSSAY